MELNFQAASKAAAVKSDYKKEKVQRQQEKVIEKAEQDKEANDMSKAPKICYGCGEPWRKAKCPGKNKACNHFKRPVRLEKYSLIFVSRKKSIGQ